jgi:sterol-4alpha-carboxylate 3-dehydrogenase (decarboxylating)
MAPLAHEKPKLGSVLVTCGSGFLGHHIVNLLTQQYKTTAISVIDHAAIPNKRPDPDGIQYYVADITSTLSVSAIMKEAKPDVVIHTGPPAAQMSNVLSTSRYDEVDVRGTQSIIEACQVHNVTALVYTSSACVISNYPSNLHNVDETWPRLRGELQPEYYAQSKVRVALRSLRHQ